MRVECQNCFTDVIPMGDGLCPSCGDLCLTQIGASFTKVVVHQRDPHAEVCMKCGVFTRERTKIRRKCRNPNFEPADNQFSRHPLALLLDFVSGKYHQSVEVTLPLCVTCRKSGRLEPKYIDFEEKSMTFVGHKAWSDELVRLRCENKQPQ
jgi:hypothetical protein